MTPVRRVRIAVNSWQAALRIAVRETRRARGRSALVIAMIALPVLALSFAAVNYDMFTLTPAEELDRRLGTADAEVTWLANGPIRQDVAGGGWVDEPAYPGRFTVGYAPPGSVTATDVTAALPPGSRAIPLDVYTMRRVSTPTASRRTSIRRFDATDPLTRGLVLLRAGRFPTAASEVALTAAAAERFGVRIGDSLDVEEIGEQRIVGLVEFPDDLGEVVLTPPPADPKPTASWLVDVPGEVDWALIRRLNQRGMLVTSRSVVLDPPAAGEPGRLPDPDGGGQLLGAGLFASGLGLLEVVLLAGPAFAVGVRRRRHDLALVAANGGTLPHLRRIVLADGVVLGLTGALIGTALGVAAALAGRPLVEEYLATARAGGYRVYPAALLTIAALAVVAGVLACLVPAYSAARQNVVAALTGRRGVGGSRRRWLVAGLLMVATGAGMSAYGASRVDSDLILAGLALAEIGLVLCTPSLVGMLARVGRLLPPAPRIALRDTARNRAAAAPAISAVMAAVAGSVALGVYIASDDARTQRARQPVVPMGYVSLNYEAPAVDLEPLPVDRIVAEAADVGLHVTAAVLVQEPGCPPVTPSEPPPGAPAGTRVNQYCTLSVPIPPERQCPYAHAVNLPREEQRRALADPRCREPDFIYHSAIADNVVDDGTALPVLTGAHGDDLARARAMLAAGGVVVTDRRQLRDGTVTVEVTRSTDSAFDPAPVTLTLPGYLLTTGVAAPRTFYSPAVLARAGLVTQPWGYVLATGAMPSEAAQERLATTVQKIAPDLGLDVERGGVPGERPTLIVLAIAAGTITLGAAAIATGLAAAEGRADLSTLAAVGASPRMRRVLSLSQSGVIAGLGSLLGIGAGLGGGCAILAALNQAYATRWPAPTRFPVTVPWSTLAILLLVPLVAMLGAGLLTRSRLPIERRRT